MTPPLPRALQVEVTGACNLRCPMCLVRYRPTLDRATASLSFAAFREMVDAVPDVEEITLQGLGEPLMAPDLFRIIEHAAARGIRVGFNTNATLLTRLCAAKPDVMYSLRTNVWKRPCWSRPRWQRYRPRERASARRKTN